MFVATLEIKDRRFQELHLIILYITFIKKLTKNKAVVCLIYILNQRKYSDICKFHHKYGSFD